MTQINIPAFSIFVGHGHVQHAGAAWSGTHNIRYHTYFAPEKMEIPDAVLFAFEDSLGIDKKETGKKANIRLLRPRRKPVPTDTDLQDSAISENSRHKSAAAQTQNDDGEDNDDILADEPEDGDGEVVAAPIPDT